MTKKIVVYRPAPDSLIANLRLDFDVAFMPGVTTADDPAFRAAVAEANGLIGASLKLDPALLDSTGALEIIASVSVGYDNYDVPDLTARDILLTNTPDVLTETTADTAFMLVMMACRRAVELAEFVKAGRWTRGLEPEMFGTDVHHKRLGILGMGRIGAAVARRGRLGFGMEILYASRSPHPSVEVELGARRLELQDLLGEADIVVCTIPLGPQTEHMIGAKEFAAMTPETVFVNASRGKVVDEAAMIAALRSGQIRAAGLDVFEQEPLPITSPLLALPNVVCLPHIGSATHETREAMIRCAADNLTAGLHGRRPPNLVNPAVWALRVQDAAASSR
ncbi:MAG: ghrB [Caulobacteraceae bacterium]|nr:ghrB [Caulobacteraceae bacterium]